MSALEWLGQLIEWITNLIPHIKLVKSTYGGVKFKWGKVVELKQGVNIYWPLTTEIEVIPTARQTKNLVTQVLTTKDHKTITIGVVIVYEINDVKKAVGTNYDINDTIYDVGQCALVGIIAGQTYDYILENCDSEIKKQLTENTRARLKPFGVRIVRCAITDFAICRVYKTLTGS
jgi:regulator of protease activity HflC (stomatin/prohibitin superfamily)